MDTDRNLLFGILALQADLIDQRQFVEACSAWAANKGVSLDAVLVERGWLSTEDRADVQKLVQRKLQKHKGDARASLAEATSDEVRHSLASVCEEVQRSLVELPSTPSPDPWATTAHQTQRRGRYSLAHLHAQGGIGQVWLARDEQLGREVALKELLPERQGHPQARERFLEEARITGQLEHPGIVPVHEMVRGDDGSAFYTMRMIRGRTLGDAIREYHKKRLEKTAGPLELRALLTAFVATCKAVAYAHSRGVIHRDLKPANVVLGDYGEVMVLDWGLAKVLDKKEDTSLLPVPVEAGSRNDTMQGQVLGTPGYMAPEQAEGRVDLLGPATDVYGLGAILYQLLTSNPPFDGGDTPAVLQRVMREEPERLRQRVPSTPCSLEAVCLKALAKKPADRYASAAELARDVEHWLADEPVSAWREPLRLRAGRWARRHKPLVAAALATLVVLLGGVTWFAVWRAGVRGEARARLDEKQHAAMAAAQSDDVDHAISLLREYEAVAETSREVGLRDHARQQRASLEKFRDFRARAAVALKEGVHNVRSKGADPVLARCEEALAVGGVLAPDFDQTSMAIGSRSRDWEEVLRKSRELLVLAAVRLAMFDSKDEAGKANTRRALGYLQRAASLKLLGPQGETITGPTAGELMLSMFWHRRLGEDKEANEAGDRMTAMVKADGGFRTARDYYLLGSITLNILKKPKEALGAYRQALKGEPTHYGALFGSYLCYSALKDYSGQVVALTACLAIRPGETDLYYFRGMAYFGQKENDLAYHDFDASVQRDPTYARGYFYRGRMLVVKEKWADAEKDFTRAVEVDSTFVQARSWRALALAKTGRPEEAAKDAETIIVAEPKAGFTLFFAARAYAQAVGALKREDGRIEKYGTRCVELLRQAFANGFRESDRLDAGGDFDPVRGRADFQALSKSVRGK